MMIDVEREKVYKGHDAMHYERFEDTIKYLSEEEWDLFIKHVREKDDPNRQRNRLIFEMLLSTGMRVEEFSLMKVSDIDFKSCIINIPVENTKSKRRRVARIKKELLLDLKDYLLNKNIKSGYIFRNERTNKPLSTRYYQKLCDKYYIKELTNKPHPHMFRHTHVIFALRNGVPINSVMQQVGHMKLTTTQIYSRLAGVDIAKGYENFNF